LFALSKTVLPKPVLLYVKWLEALGKKLTSQIIREKGDSPLWPFWVGVVVPTNMFSEAMLEDDNRLGVHGLVGSGV
jgi:hypothetical protein